MLIQLMHLTDRSIAIALPGISALVSSIDGPIEISGKSR